MLYGSPTLKWKLTHIHQAHQNLQLVFRELIQLQQVNKPTQTFKENAIINKILKEKTIKAEIRGVEQL